MANEEKGFKPFIEQVTGVLDRLGNGAVYLITDSASKDRTPELCKQLAILDKRFIAIFAPENQNVVDAYLCGYREAYSHGHQFIIEMDAGLSHNPCSIPVFLNAFQEGYECVFGSRFIEGGTMENAPLKRKLLSKFGTVLANGLLGTDFKDMTSGFQGFSRQLVGKLIGYPLLSTAHFYQTEVRYLLRKRQYIELPITYTSPSPRVSARSILNSMKVLLVLFFLRLTFRAPAL